MAEKAQSHSSKTALVRRLAENVLNVGAGVISADVALQAKMLILDSIGCALAAGEEDAYVRARKTFEALGGNPDCTIIGSRRRMPVTHAVMLNGILIRELDLNDVYIGPGLTGHPSDNIAVALTVGERQKSSGLDVLTSVAVGYEVYCRIQDLSTAAGPWDHVTASALAAPAIAGRLLKLDVGQMANALALSAVHGNTLAAVRSGQLSNAKAMANAVVAQTATLCTLLASEGMTGPMSVLEGRGGFNQGLLAGADLDVLVGPIGDRLKISEVGIKAYPCIGTAQAMVAAVLALRSTIDDPIKEIKDVELRMADIPFVRGQVEDEDRRHPSSRETADHSFYYLAAIALRDGELTQAQFEGERWLDPSVKALMERMRIRTDAGLNGYTPGSYPCVAHVIGIDGASRTAEVFYPKGHPQNRMSPSEVKGKFRGSTRAVLSEARQTEVIALVDRLESLASVRELMNILAIGRD
jgi:2-methylcitrate dehydratase